MSRHSYLTQGKQVAYGFDHVFGYFIQVFDEASEDPEIPIIDADSVTHSRGELIDLFEAYKVFERNPEHMEMICLDLPIE